MTGAGSSRARPFRAAPVTRRPGPAANTFKPPGRGWPTVFAGDRPMGRHRPDRDAVLRGALVLNTELLVVLGYVLLASPGVGALPPLRTIAFYTYPFVWLNVGLFAVVRTERPPAPGGRRAVALVAAAGYLLVLGYAGGLYGPGGGGPGGLRLAVASLPPGWSPAVLYAGPLVDVALIPFKVVGYAALAYLVYLAVLAADRSLLGGTVGLFACASCALPAVAGVVSGTVGGGTALVAAAGRQSYAASTVAYVLAVGLLAWWPSLSRTGR